MGCIQVFCYILIYRDFGPYFLDLIVAGVIIETYKN